MWSLSFWVIGNTPTGVVDMGTTPFGPNQPNILLHATALNDLLQDSAIRRTGRRGDALALLLVPLLMAVSGRFAKKRSLFLFWIAGTAGILALGLATLFKMNVLVAAVTTATLWTAATVVELARRHTQELVARQRLRSTMALYFSPRVLDDVLANPGSLEPKNVEITVLLTDLRNSTPLAERLGAEGMLRLLNRVFEVQTRAAFAEDGSLERPVGDQFLAYWNAPEPQPDATDRALRAALAMIEWLEDLRTRLEPQIAELFGYGVGLHAGSALMGNVGSAPFFHYGLVGDLINATARIEGLTKHYGVPLIITREVYARLSAPPPARVLDHVIVKGKSTPLELLEVRHQSNAARFSEIAADYDAAFACYQGGDFAAAVERFRKCSAEDRPSALLAERARVLAAHPPPDWSGVFRMEDK